MGNAANHRAWRLAAGLTIAAACAPQPRPLPPGPVQPQQPGEPGAVERPDVTPFVVGAVLPLTGAASLSQYGAAVRIGIEIATPDSVRDRPVEVVFVDDGGNPARAAQHIRALAQSGVSVIIGPLLADAVDAAAAARPDPSLALVSPTSTDRSAAPNTYTLNADDTRGAEALAEYAVRGGMGPIGVLYSQEPTATRLAQAFRAAVVRAGGTIASDVIFAQGTTTFADPLERLRSAGVRSVYIPASERDIRQLAPQIEYYGLGGVQVLGGDAWVADEVLRGVPARILERVVAAVPLFETSPAVAWGEFVGLYEASQRRSLDSPYPALGYDAMRLVIEAAAQEGTDADDVARGLRSTERFRGATGVITLTSGSAVREPFLVQIRGGRPVLLTGALPGR